MNDFKGAARPYPGEQKPRSILRFHIVGCLSRTYCLAINSLLLSKNERDTSHRWYM